MNDYRRRSMAKRPMLIDDHEREAVSRASTGRLHSVGVVKLRGIPVTDAK